MPRYVYVKAIGLTATALLVLALLTDVLTFAVFSKLSSAPSGTKSDATHPGGLGVTLASSAVWSAWAEAIETHFWRSVGSTAGAKNVELVGRIGGAVEVVTVQGDYAYIGEGPRLTIVDVSNPASPTVVGRTSLMPDVVDVAVVGNHAYVADGSGSLRVVDVSDLTNPTEVGHRDTPGNALDVAVVGDCAYVADENGGLRVVDVSDPTNPTEVGYCDTMYVLGVAVAGDYAYVADGYGGWVVDVSDPANPTEMGYYDTGLASDVAPAGDYAYVTDYYSGLWVFDVSDPANPTEVGLDSVLGCRCVAVAGGYAYVAEGGDGLRVVDVSDPAWPTEVGHYDTPDWARDVVVVGDYAYIANCSAGLRVADISDPTNPAEVGYCDMPGNASSVAVAGDYAYVTDEGDIADWNAGLRVVDVSDPTNPIEVGRCDMPGNASGVAVAGDYAYVANSFYGLRVVDISDPINPTEVGRCYMPGHAKDVAIVGDYAYVADWDKGLRVADISDPTNPTEIGFYVTPGDAAGVAVVGDYAYVADETSDYDSGLRIVNVSDPTSPAEVGYYDVPGEANAQEVAVAEERAYVAASDSLRVVDVSNPASPAESGYYPTNALGVTVAGDYIYVADGYGGFLILRNLPSYSISGHVRGSGGNPVADVQVSAEAAGSATTDAEGIYAIGGLITGTHTLTPSKDDWVFRPANLTVSVPPNGTGRNFIILPRPVSITLSLSGTASLPNVLSYVDTQGLTTTLAFPYGAVTESVTIVLTPTVAAGGAGWAFAGHAFDLEAYEGGEHWPNFAFNEPVTVTINYSETDVRTVSDEKSLMLRWWAGDEWRDAVCASPPLTYTRNLTSRVLSVPICHLSHFGLFGPTHQMYLPLVLRSE